MMNGATLTSSTGPFARVGIDRVEISRVEIDGALLGLLGLFILLLIL